MSIICPTVLADNPHTFREQVERLQPFAERVQIDLADGDFAPTKSIMPIQVWWPDEWTVDIHLMFKNPREHLETLISLHPHMVILHAEAEGDIKALLEHFQKVHIKAGIALLKDTQPEQVRDSIEIADHVLLFGGNLGHFGGTADLEVLKKIPAIKAINPKIEIGWDGGANEENVIKLQEAGVDVINVGGAIQRADNPAVVYDTLVHKIA